MLGWVKSWLRDVVSRFVTNKAGNVAIVFGLSLLPLITAGGVAVDMSRAMIVRHRLSEALDAAGLAAGRQFDQGLETVTAVAQQYFNANYPVAELGVPGVLQVSMEGGSISLSASAAVDTTLMQIVGFEYLNVGVSSEITREGKSLEIGIALDVTGSMAGQKIIDLRTSAKELVDLLVWDQQDQFYSKVALVPYSHGVNVGTYANSVRGAPPAALSITGATWGKAITGATWKQGSAKTMTGASSFTGSAKNISNAEKLNPVRITSNNHGFTNGQTVYIAGVNGMTQINNRIFTVTSASTNQYRLSGVNGTSYSNYSSGGNGRRCPQSDCAVVVTSSSHGFTNGDTVYLSGVGGMSQINNEIHTVANVTSNTFVLSGEIGTTHSAFTSGGTAQECAVAGCYVVITSSGHGFSNGNSVHIDGVGGMTQINDDEFTVANAATNTFVLSGEVGTSHSNYTSGGRVCLTSNCPVTITANNHGFSNGNSVYITGVGGMTQLNDQVFTVASATTNTFDLSGINGSTYNTYTSGGSAYCTYSGCQYFHFTNAASTPAQKTFVLQSCVSERVGDDEYTDAAPSTTYVGRLYRSSSSPCLSNQIVPLSTDKTYLKAQIDLYQAVGSTSGHVGLAWAWYMISPNFGYLWPSSSQPAANGGNVLKIAILMTDGAFNSPYCQGVIAADATSGSGSSSDHINCNATNGDSYTQGHNICDAIKDEEIEVYTVGFDIGDQTDAINLMAQCATDDAHAYLAENGAELTAAFQAIATDISQLRLSK